MEGFSLALKSAWFRLLAYTGNQVGKVANGQRIIDEWDVMPIQ
jgi:hypothetical protein